MCVEQVEWFIPERKGQQLQQMKLKAQEPESNETDLNARRSRMESGEIVVIRDESGSAAYTGSAVLAQSFYWLYRATVRIVHLCCLKTNYLQSEVSAMHAGICIQNNTKYVEWGWDLFTGTCATIARIPYERHGALA